MLKYIFTRGRPFYINMVTTCYNMLKTLAALGYLYIKYSNWFSLPVCAIKYI